MRKLALLPGVFAAVIWVGGCSAARDTVTPVPKETAESLYHAGHLLYAVRDYDSAVVLLEGSLEEDSTFVPAISDLASLYYDRGVEESGEGGSLRRVYLERSFGYFANMESLGKREGQVYDRLCEIAVHLGDTDAFVRYAEKYAEAYPYDRQYYNLGRAYFDASDYREAIALQKKAVEMFPGSNYVGGFYRLLGQAYMKVDRYQTAQRVFAAGVGAVDARLSDLRDAEGYRRDSADEVKLEDDQTSMLRSLRYLYRLYKKEQKLQEVERRLKEVDKGN
ncbi:MAG: tetratricopeptide repeat protein [Bacteroidota bacterium]